MSTPRQYRKKPVVIEAMHLFGLNAVEPIRRWGLANGQLFKRPAGAYGDHVYLIIETLEGEMTADEGDWIIKGAVGEFYPIKPDVFDATYEAVPDA